MSQNLSQNLCENLQKSLHKNLYKNPRHLCRNIGKFSHSLRAIFIFGVFFAILSLSANVASAASIDSTPKPKNTQNLNVPKAFVGCVPCHGENGQKVAPGAKGGATIAGLNKQKLIADLRGYRAKRADNGGAKFIMYNQAENLSDADIEALASYISSLPKKREQNTK